MAGEESALDTVAQAQATPEKRVRRWLLELKLAKKREKDWRIKAQEILDLYRGKNRKKNTFNILWSNTEVLRPALYNSSPKPDVRRRFRQKDMLGKAVSELMERSLSFCADAYDFDGCIKADVFDSLVPGRGISRVRYVPQFKKVPEAAPELPAGSAKPPTFPSSNGVFPDAKQPALAEGSEAFGGEREEVDYEQALCEHVQWDDFLHGPGKTWNEVEWVAFRHRLRRDDLIERFGAKIGGAIVLNDVQDDDLSDRKKNTDVADVFKRAEVWEVWDKEEKEVFFVNETYRKGVFYALAEDGQEEGEPPLKLRDFFPVPRPLLLVEDTTTLVPCPVYELYREQAEELDRISFRINKVVRALRIRGIYDSTLGELSELMRSGDNELLPAEQAAKWMQNGGIEKAIWFMPTQQAALVLAALYDAREKAKQVIYELTGIADVLRSASDPEETLGAQKIKANNFRVQRMQREVQRYVRDLIRLLAEVIGQHFDQKTLAGMTGLQFPTMLQKQAIGLQAQAMREQMAQAQATGQPQQPPPAMQAIQNALQMPSWEDIMQCFRADICREYRIDVETDSTVAEQLQSDTAGMREVMTGVVELFQGLAPAVVSGALNVEAAKSIVMSFVRRARMGLEVEDALEQGMQTPKTTDPNAGKAQAEMAKIQAQMAAQKAEGERQLQVEAAKHQREVLELQQKHATEIQDRQAEWAIERYKVDKESDTKIAVAEIGANATLEASLQAAEQHANTELAQGTQAPQDAQASRPKRRPSVLKSLTDAQAAHAQRMEAHAAAMTQAHQQLASHVAAHIEQANAPSILEKGPDGKTIAVHKGNKRLPIIRHPDGRVQIGISETRQ